MVYLIILNLVFLLLILYLIKRCIDYRYDQKTFRRLMDHIHIGYYRYRYKDGVILAANKGFLKILELGEDVNNIVGRSLSELLIYVDGERSIREQLRTRGALRNHEYHFRTLKGKDKWVLHNSYIIKDPYYGEEVIEALIEDITEEKSSHARMKESQERYEKLFKNSGDMVIICRLDDFVIEEVNPVTELVTGFSKDELVGTFFYRIIHPYYRENLSQIRQDLLFQGSSRFETVMVSKMGTYKDVIMTLSVVEIKDDRIVMAVVKDVSEPARKKEEEERRRKELEDFWKASVEREERIKDLKIELKKAKDKIRNLKEKYEKGYGKTSK